MEVIFCELPNGNIGRSYMLQGLYDRWIGLIEFNQNIGIAKYHQR